MASAEHELSDILCLYELDPKNAMRRVDAYGRQWCGFRDPRSTPPSLVIYRKLTEAEHERRVAKLTFWTWWTLHLGGPRDLPADMELAKAFDWIFAIMEWNELEWGLDMGLDRRHTEPKPEDGECELVARLPEGRARIVRTYRRATPAEVAAPDRTGPRYWKFVCEAREDVVRTLRS